MPVVRKLIVAMVFTAAIAASLAGSAMAQTSPDFPTGGAIVPTHSTSRTSVGSGAEAAALPTTGLFAFMGTSPYPIVFVEWLPAWHAAPPSPVGQVVGPVLPARRRVSR